MITINPLLYIAVIGLLLAIGLVAFALIAGEIVREWKEFKHGKQS